MQAKPPHPPAGSSCNNASTRCNDDRSSGGRGPGNDRMLRVVRGAGRRSWGILAGRFRRRIDPYGGRQGFWAWWSADESLRMRGGAAGSRRGQCGADRMRGGWAAGAKDVARVKLGSASIDGRLCLGLRFQLRVMFRQKRSNVIGHGQQCDPLFLIERDRKATEAIHRPRPPSR